MSIIKCLLGLAQNPKENAKTLNYSGFSGIYDGGLVGHSISFGSQIYYFFWIQSSDLLFLQKIATPLVKTLPQLL